MLKSGGTGSGVEVAAAFAIRRQSSAAAREHNGQRAHLGVLVKYRFGAFELDEQLWELRQHGEQLPIQRKALETVLFLIRHRARVVSRDELRAGLWPGTAVTDTAIAHAIMQARRALGDGRESWIHTVRGKGVRFIGEVEEQQHERGRSYERLEPTESGAPPSGEVYDASEFERQFLRCLQRVLDVAVEVLSADERSIAGSESARERRIGRPAFHSVRESQSKPANK